MVPSALAPLSSKAVVGSPIAEDSMPFRYERRVHDRGLFMVEALRKRSEDVLDYHLDFTHWLEAGETVESARAWVEPMGEATPGDLFVFKVQFGDSGALVWLANGADGGRALVYVRVGTSGGRFKLVRFAIFTRGVPTDLVFFSGDASVTVGGNPTGDPIIDPPPPPPDPTVTRILAADLLSLTFAAIDIGDVSAPQEITLSNTGNTALAVSSLVLTGDFEVSDAAGALIGTPFSIPPAAATVIKVVFGPTAVGARTGSLAISSNGGNVVIALSGVATALPQFVISNAEIVNVSDPPPPDPLPVPVATLSVTTLSFPDTTV